VEQFVADTSSDKRVKLIDTIMKRPEFVDYWAYKWSDMLLVTSNRLSDEEMWAYYEWIHDSVASNKPWDKFVYQIVTATGNTVENGAANYWLVHRDPLDTTETWRRLSWASQLPVHIATTIPWQMDAKRLLRHGQPVRAVRLKTYSPSTPRRGQANSFNNVTVYSAPTGEFTDDRFMTVLPPKPLDASALPETTPGDTRVYFAKWLTAPQNPFFARNAVNRIWRDFMGRGLVESIEDLRDTNPATNDQLLNDLVKDFVAHNFDVDYLIRTIMQSATYQASSTPLKENSDDDKFGSHYVIKRLPAEVLLDAYSQITKVPEHFEGYPAGTRALQLPDSAVKSYFLSAFGRPVRAQTRESERTSVPTVTQALHIFNGDTLNDKLRAPGSATEMLVKLGFTDDQIVDYLYLASFSRHPKDNERKALVDALKSAEAQKGQGDEDTRRAALNDLAWAMLTSEEFMFNH